MNCTYLDHVAPATHFYNTAGGSTRHLCADCASRFGYPQYLVAVAPKTWRKEYGYLINSQVGDGQSRWDNDTWPMVDADDPEAWLKILGCPEPDYMLADASWEPYRPHYAENGGLTFEVRRVTCLPVM